MIAFERPSHSGGVLAAMSFELGVRAPEELEARGRGLLRGEPGGWVASAILWGLDPSAPMIQSSRPQ